MTLASAVSGEAQIGLPPSEHGWLTDSLSQGKEYKRGWEVNVAWVGLQTSRTGGWGTGDDESAVCEEGEV